MVEIIQQLPQIEAMCQQLYLTQVLALAGPY